MGKDRSEESQKNIDYFDMLPEGCIAEIVSHTTPADACHVALVSTTFHSVADSDPVWNTFLPSDYRQFLSRAVENQPIHHVLRSSPSNKDLYLSLSDHPLIIDSASMSFSLDKWTGKKCFMMAASTLTIVWGDTPRYWRWTSDLESRFGKVIELISVCWFEIHGRISTSLLSGDTAYTTYLVYKPATTISGFEDLPLEISVGIIGEESIKRNVFVDPEGGVQRKNFSIPRRLGLFHNFRASHPRAQVALPLNVDRQYPRTRKDGWLELELAQYFNKEGENRDLEISLLEVKGGNWKSGLIIQGIEIRPMGVLRGTV
ncbi:Phloem protein 2-6 [Heracleum sosnowskyi]|uniref:Phloem protein 2-6 n=1 Tax=Heracleum sosnowskyi TaxID=360622 RepID=A0AAD8IPP3_9APIA|nr:Phloem protein 2-6 [Heracleum sosnowskyi]